MRYLNTTNDPKVQALLGEIGNYVKYAFPLRRYNLEKAAYVRSKIEITFSDYT